MLALVLVVVLLATGNAWGLDGGGSPCAPTDYTAAFTPCNLGSGFRTKTFVLRQGASCVGNATLPGVAMDVSCECDLSEYVHSCQQQTYITPSGCTPNPAVLASLLANGAPTQCDCIDADIGSSYTLCNKTAKSFDLVSFWKNHGCRDTGAIRLPQAVAIGCGTECSSGKYLGAPYAKCHNCSSGTWSFQGESYHPPFYAFPENWHNFCDGEGCQVWGVHEFMFDSGDQQKQNDVYTGIKFFVDVVTAPAIMTIKYRVSSELNGDGFLVFANDVRMHTASGDSGKWEEASVDLGEANGQCKWELTVLSPDSFHQVKVCIDRSEITPYSSDKHFASAQSPYVGKLVAPSDSQAVGCNPGDYSAATMAGNIAIVIRGQCSFVTKVRMAQNAGAVVVLVVDSIVEGHLYMGGDGPDITVPAGVIANNPGATILSSVRDGGLVVNVSIARVNIYVGRVEIELVYYKDGDTSVGSDRVYIRSVEITGTKLAASKCHACQPGWSSPSGSSRCRPCPSNHFSNEWGVAEPCKACPENTLSVAGSTVCELKQSCTIEDYTPMFSHCALSPSGDYIKTMTFAEIVPATCDHAKQAFQVPTPVDMPCGECDVGKFRNLSHRCQLCPLGSVPNSVGGCTPCGEGTYTQQRLTYKNFNSMEGEFPPGWRARCWLCFGRQGWDFIPMNPEDRFRTTQLVTGRGLEEHAFTHLSRNFTLGIDGYVSFTYYLLFGNSTDLENSVHVEFRLSQVSGIDEGDVIASEALVRNGAVSAQESKFTQNLQAGDYTMDWKYTKLTMTNIPILFVIATLDVVGDIEGGAATCTGCPPGHFCEYHASKATPCPPGTSAMAGMATKCDSCPMGTVQRIPGGIQCTECAKPFVPDVTQTVCVLPPGCMADIGTNRYNLSAIGRAGPIAVSRNSTTTTQNTDGETQFKDAFQGLASSGFYDICGLVDGRRFARKGIQLQPTHAVISFEKGDSYDMGSDVSIGALFDDNGDLSLGLRVQFSGGDWCPDDHSVRMVTYVDLMCTPTNRDTIVTFSTGATACAHVFVVRSPSACPLCTNASYYQSVDACDSTSNVRRKRYYFNTTDMQPNCYGGVPMPAEVVEDCPLLTIDISRKDLALVYGLTIGSGVFVILLLVGLFYLYFSKRSLGQRYDALALVPPSGPVEMSERN